MYLLQLKWISVTDGTRNIYVLFASPAFRGTVRFVHLRGPVFIAGCLERYHLDVCAALVNILIDREA
jgi:hypothetical protein